MLMNTVMFTIAMLAVLGTAGAYESIIALKLSKAYTIGVRQLYIDEGIVSKTALLLLYGTDLDGDGVEDFDQIHSINGTVWFRDGDVDVNIRRDPTNPHAAIIQAGRVEIIVNNFPGGGQSCQNNNQCNPELIAWRELQ